MDDGDMHAAPGTDWDLDHPDQILADWTKGTDPNIEPVGFSTEHGPGWNDLLGHGSEYALGHSGHDNPDHDPDLDGGHLEIGSSMAPLARLASQLISQAHDLSVHSMPAHPDHFDPAELHHDVDGNPGEHMDSWHMQEHPDTCAVVSQEYILEHVLGHPIREGDLVHEAQEAGVYRPGGGTSLEDVGRLLELHGVQVERSADNSVDDISQALDAGHHVIACVDANELTHHGLISSLFEVVGLPGRSAGHAVEVIGVNRDNPTHPMVVLNDPGRPDGCGIEVPAEVFDRAWEHTGHFMVTTTNDAAAGPGHEVAASFGPQHGWLDYYRAQR